MKKQTCNILLTAAMSAFLMLPITVSAKATPTIVSTTPAIAAAASMVTAPKTINSAKNDNNNINIHFAILPEEELTHGIHHCDVLFFQELQEWLCEVISTRKWKVKVDSRHLSIADYIKYRFGGELVAYYLNIESANARAIFKFKLNEETIEARKNLRQKAYEAAMEAQKKSEN